MCKLSWVMAALVFPLGLAEEHGLWCLGWTHPKRFGYARLAVRCPATLTSGLAAQQSLDGCGVPMHWCLFGWNKIVVRHDWIYSYHLEAHKIINMYSIYQLEAQKPIIMELENPGPVLFHQCRAAVRKACSAVVNHLPVDEFPFFPERLEIWTGFLGGYPPSN